jgi:hypothetical protein
MDLEVCPVGKLTVRYTKNVLIVFNSSMRKNAMKC